MAQDFSEEAVEVLRRRYGRMFDTILSASDDDSSTIIYEEYEKACVQSLDAISLEKGKTLAQRQWYILTGGHPDVKELNRHQSINLAVKGFLSKDESHVTKLKETLRESSEFSFNMVDIRGLGYITERKWLALGRQYGMKDARRAFRAMNLNGDGKLSKEEVIQCYEGFFFNPADRFNYCVGIAGE